MANLAYAYYYARYVIKGRWLEAEPTIMKDSDSWRLYKDRFKCCNWPKVGSWRIDNSELVCYDVRIETQRLNRGRDLR